MSRIHDTPPGEATEPRLFGLAQTNRRPEELWGKNCFNNAFPVALACYMWEQGTRAVYVNVAKSGGGLSFSNNEIDIGRVFNAPAKARYEDLRFEFETKFKPYLDYALVKDDVDSADLVVRHGDDWLRPLQIKLTVTPDETTSKKDRIYWSPELVFRPADSCVCALGIHRHIASQSEEVKSIFIDICAGIDDWNSKDEVGPKRHRLLDCVERFLSKFHKHQQPYLLHPIWMTEGKSPALNENAFDVFVWSDFALISAYLEQAKGEGDISRATRAVIRFARAQYELSTLGKIQIQRIYKDMSYGKQTDKELAMSGGTTQKYMTSPRRASPAIPPDVLPRIILNGGQRQLSPERRFDQTIYFTAERYF